MDSFYSSLEAKEEFPTKNQIFKSKNYVCKFSSFRSTRIFEKHSVNLHLRCSILPFRRERQSIKKDEPLEYFPKNSVPPKSNAKHRAVFSHNSDFL